MRGKNEADDGKVTLRNPVNKTHQGALPASEAVAMMVGIVADRKLPECI